MLVLRLALLLKQSLRPLDQTIPFGQGLAGCANVLCFRLAKVGGCERHGYYQPCGQRQLLHFQSCLGCSFAAKVEGMPLKTTSFHSQHVGSTSHCRRFSDQVSPRMNHPTNQSLCKLMKISLLHLLAKSLPLLLLRFEVGP